MSTSSLQVVVVGGGIGGLAAANALIRRGLKVQVYEQAAALSEVGAGIAIQPNGLRMLRRLGLGADLERRGARWRDPQFRRADGTLVAPMWPAGVGEEIEIYGMHRADLLQMLVDRLPPDVIHTGHRCIGFEQDDEQAVLTFECGAQVQADVVIAADGIHSTLQQYVTPPSPPLPSGSMAYRGVVSAASVSWQAGAMRNWMGDRKHFLVYPVRAGELINYVGFVPTDEQMKESWSAPGDPAALAREFSAFDPLVLAILAQVTACFRWGLYDREPLPTWTRGRLALLGDAAHPMLPHVGQGANQAIEDGMALAAILSRADRATVPAMLRIYEAVRRDHTSRVQRMARVNGARYNSQTESLADRDRRVGDQSQERASIWAYDAETEATAALEATP